MPSVTYPAVLTPANWDKQKGFLAKVKLSGIKPGEGRPIPPFPSAKG